MRLTGPRTVDVVVVGGGLFGSAASRHLAEAGHRVAVVTSPEPPDNAYSSTSGPFASHYDQGRIVRCGGIDPVFAEAGRRSFERFADLEQRSGISFFQPRPLVAFSDDAELDYEASVANGADVALASIDEVRTRFGIALPAGFEGGAVVETATAGFINPRLLVAAQLAVAGSAGANVITIPAAAIRVAEDRAVVEMVDGGEIQADQVIIATGAYGGELLAAGLDIDVAIQRRLRTVALIELDQSLDQAANLPSLSGQDFNHPRGEPLLEEMYWVPPVRYPDGGIYLKIGGNSLPMVTASPTSISEDIAAWFSSGASESEAEALFALTRELLPTIDMRLAGHKPCVVSYTADEQPIIARHNDRVVLALAGNGSGAKASDDFGRQAAALAAKR